MGKEEQGRLAVIHNPLCETHLAMVAQVPIRVSYGMPYEWFESVP